MSSDNSSNHKEKPPVKFWVGGVVEARNEEELGKIFGRAFKEAAEALHKVQEDPSLVSPGCPWRIDFRDAEYGDEK
jgi:hypothetical protein